MRVWIFWLFLIGLGMTLVGCTDSRSPEEQKAAYQASLQYVDARALGNGSQVMLRFAGGSTFDLAEALEKYVAKHQGKRRVVSISPWPRYGDANFSGYWVLVEDVK